MLTRQHQKEHARKSSTHPMNMFNTLQHHQLYQHQSEFILLIQLKQHCHKTPSHTHIHTNTKKTDSVHQVTSLPQFTMFHFSIPLLTVDKNILDGHVACTHEIVPDAASFHYALRRLCSILHSAEQYLKPECRGVFYHSPDL